MDNKINKSRKRHSAGTQGLMLKKILKTMPHFKENFPRQSFNNNIDLTIGLKKVLGL